MRETVNLVRKARWFKSITTHLHTNKGATSCYVPVFLVERKNQQEKVTQRALFAMTVITIGEEDGVGWEAMNGVVKIECCMREFLFSFYWLL